MTRVRKNLVPKRNEMKHRKTTVFISKKIMRKTPLFDEELPNITVEKIPVYAKERPKQNLTDARSIVASALNILRPTVVQFRQGF